MTRSRISASFFAVFISVAIQAAHAQTTPPASPVVVTVAFNAAVMQSAEAQRDFTALQAKFAPRQAHLQSLNNDIEGLKKQVNDSSNHLSEEDKAAKVRALDEDERRLQREAEDFKSDTDSASQQAFQGIAQKLYAFLQDYAKQHAYSVVIDRGPDTTPLVWYTAAGVDITDQLVHEYNLKSGVNSSSGTTPSKDLPSSPTPRHP